LVPGISGGKSAPSPVVIGDECLDWCQGNFAARSHRGRVRLWLPDGCRAKMSCAAREAFLHKVLRELDKPLLGTGNRKNERIAFACPGPCLPTIGRESLRITLEGWRGRHYHQWIVGEVVVISDGSNDEHRRVLSRGTRRHRFTLRPLIPGKCGAEPLLKQVREQREHCIDDDVEPVPHSGDSRRASCEDDKAVAIGPLSPDPALRNTEAVWIG